MRRARYSIDVDGLAQGVGFRPFVHGLARRYELGGWVYNAGGGVHIEVEGEQAALDDFVSALRLAIPEAASPRHIAWRPASLRGERGFLIADSRSAGSANVVIPADLATCDACLHELFDRNDRRFEHPFINCTQCGPRATVVLDMPYDRERTTMSGFALCVHCRDEYADPNDRRFHAQPIACGNCGPRLALLDARGLPLASRSPLADLATAVLSGRIVALKGIGGFHLLCDASNHSAVSELRKRKQREGKPFAVMVQQLAAAEWLCELDDAARAALCSPARPIVLAPAKTRHALSPAIAPGLQTLGLMLPYAPVHHLLLRRLSGHALVVTSGNRSDDPIAISDVEAVEQLGGVADLFVTHDRPIRVRFDDSVVRARAGAVLPIRRARGFAPLPLDLPFEVTPATLAVGGHIKAVFALAAGRSALLGPHCGELGSLRAYAAWSDAIAHFESVSRMRPLRIAHDLHPDYASSRYASERAARDGLPLIAVQHHHAHMASCMADNGLDGDVIGVIFDGTGLGADGTIWGGELLVGGYRGYVRAAHLLPVPLPGGDRAAREPWRMALSHARAAGVTTVSDELARTLDHSALAIVTRMLESGTNAPPTSSMGRLFDAVAAIAGVLAVASYEGEAAMRLEALAQQQADDGAYPVELRPGEALGIDCAPLIREVARDAARGVELAIIARRFHSAVVELVARACSVIRARHGVDRVVLSGGVFANAILGGEVPARLREEGFTVFMHRNVPPNDGGLCLGQLAVAAHAAGAS
jgi:hydrogenase maturation protein HypF